MMKLLWLFLLVMPCSFRQAESFDIIDTTAELIKKGDIHELAKYFSSTVELNILGEENVCSNTQAEMLLVDFFKQRQPKSIKILHRISSNTNYRFGVFLLATNNGTYRISIALKNIDNQFVVNDFRIEIEKVK